MFGMYVMHFGLVCINRESNRCFSGIRRLGIIYGNMWHHQFYRRWVWNRFICDI